MAQVNFEKLGNVWVASADVNGDFNLHIETGTFGRLIVRGSTVEDGSKADWANIALNPPAYDHDYSVLVTPKHLEFVSTVEVTSATITEKEG